MTVKHFHVDRESPKYKVGDKVIIVDNVSSHGFDVGASVEIEAVYPHKAYEATDEAGYSWLFQEHECIPHLEDKEQPQEADMVNSPSHYGQGTIECIDYISDFLTRNEYIGYLRGNIAKYLHRYRYKNGLEDLKKAQWYLNRLIETEEGF